MSNLFFIFFTESTLDERVNSKIKRKNKNDSHYLELNYVGVKNHSNPKELEYEAKIKMWTYQGISIDPLYSNWIKMNHYDGGIYYVKSEWIETYEELKIDTVVVHYKRTNSEKYEKYEFRFGSAKSKEKFINMFRVPR